MATSTSMETTTTPVRRTKAGGSPPPPPPGPSAASAVAPDEVPEENDDQLLTLSNSSAFEPTSEQPVLREVDPSSGSVTGGRTITDHNTREKTSATPASSTPAPGADNAATHKAASTCASSTVGGGHGGDDDEPPRKDVIDDKRDGNPPKPKAKAKAKRQSARSASGSPQPRCPEEYTPARERHAADLVRRLHPGAGAWTPADLLSIGRARVEERQLGMVSPSNEHSESFSSSWFAASTADEREAAFNRMVENRARVLAEEAELQRLVEIRARRRAREQRSKSVVRISEAISQPDDHSPERAVETGVPSKRKKKPRDDPNPLLGGLSRLMFPKNAQARAEAMSPPLAEVLIATQKSHRGIVKTAQAERAMMVTETRMHPGDIFPRRSMTITTAGKDRGAMTLMKAMMITVNRKRKPRRRIASLPRTSRRTCVRILAFVRPIKAVRNPRVVPLPMTTVISGTSHSWSGRLWP